MFVNSNKAVKYDRKAPIEGIEKCVENVKSSNCKFL